MATRDFKYFNEMAKKIPNSQVLVKLVQFYDFAWQKDLMENLFSMNYERSHFYNIISDKLVEYKEYTMEIHKILLDNLSGKNIADISKSANLSQEIVEEYQDKFLKSKNIMDCIDFTQVIGADIDKIEQKVLKSTNADAYIYFIQVSPKVHKSLFEMRIIELISKARGNAKLVAQRQKAYKIIKAFADEKEKEL